MLPSKMYVGLTLAGPPCIRYIKTICAFVIYRIQTLCVRWPTHVTTCLAAAETGHDSGPGSKPHTRV